MSKKFMASKKSIALVLVLVPCWILMILTACAAPLPSPANSPAVKESPPPTATVTVSPEITPSGENAPGAVTEATAVPLESPGLTGNAQSPMIEEAVKISVAAKKIEGVEQVAAIVTEDQECVVALKIKPKTALDDSMKNQIMAAAGGDTKVKITADEAVFEQISKLEKELQSGKSISFEEVKAVWQKIK